MPNNTVTINIQNNCGCPGGSQAYTGDGGGIIDGSWDDIPLPSGTDGPPVGYLTATSISDRQCRVAIFNYWWVYYLTDKLANTTTGQLYLSFANSAVLPELVKGGVSRILIPIVTAAVVALGTAGIEVSDLLTAPVAFALSSVLVGFLTDFINENNITEVKLIDIFDKLPNCKDQLICVLSKSTSETVESDLTNLLKDPVFDLSESQQEYIVLLAGTFAKALYYTPEWWPSFDTETLSSITANCCGSFIDGTALLPSSTEGCQTSYYIVDKLAGAFSGIQEYCDWYYDFVPNLNPFDDDTAEIFDKVAVEIDSYLPQKIVQRASIKANFYTGIAQYIAYNRTIYNFPDLFNYPYWSDLAEHLATSAPAIRSTLAAALDVDDVYTAIYNPIEAWLDINVTDTDLNTYMKNAINGLIQPTGSTEDYLNMMFYQDADLATYAAADCSGTVDPAADSPSAQCGADTAIGTYDFSLGQYNWSASGHLCNPVYDAALGEFRAATWDPGRGSMTLTQGVSHNVQSMTVHYRGPAGGSGSISAGNVGNIRQIKTVSGGTGSVTFTNLCIVSTTPVSLSGMIANGSDAWIAITEIEFHQ